MSSTSDRKGPLAGIRVIDLTSVVFGPYATQIMADMGADVIKVEPPEGDLLRASGGSLGRDKRMGPIYMAANRNKRSLCLDLKKPAACAVLKDLIKGADLFIHNSRPQAIERLGLAMDWPSGSRLRQRAARRLGLQYFASYRTTTGATTGQRLA